MTTAIKSPSTPRLTKAELAEIAWIDKLIAHLTIRRRKVKQKAHARTEHWRRTHR